jgi:hypothetical protein
MVSFSKLVMRRSCFHCLSKTLISRFCLIAESLTSDPNAELVQSLYQSLVGDPRVFESAALPDLLPILLKKEDNPKVCGLLCHLAPYIVPRLMSLRRVNVIMKLLL